MSDQIPDTNDVVDLSNLVAGLSDQAQSGVNGKTPKRVDATQEQRKKWVETRTAFVWSAPAFSSIFYNMMADHNDDAAYFTEEVSRVGTDGKHLFINPETFFVPGRSIGNRVFDMAEAVCHAMFDHMGTRAALKKKGELVLPDGTRMKFNEQTYDMAIDYVTHALLVESKIGTLPDGALYDTQIARGTDNVFEVYKKIFIDEDDGGGGGGGGGGSGGGSGSDDTPPGNSGGGKSNDQGDNHMAPGTGDGQSPDQAQSERSDLEWKNAVAGAMASAAAQGKLPDAMKRLFQEVLEPQVSWQDHIRSLLTRTLGNDARSWKKLDKRLIVRGIGAPGRVGYGCGLVVIGIDTSGSITPDMVDKFLAEVKGVLEDVRPREVKLMWCDADVHRVDEVEDVADLDAVRALGAPGGGGTAFEPVFERVYNDGDVPDALLYLTDGLGSFPETPPDFPVIWGSIYPRARYPFGEVVDIPING